MAIGTIIHSFLQLVDHRSSLIIFTLKNELVMDAKIYQSFDPSLPVPIAFSGWKHHMGFIATSINKLSVKIDDATITAICHGIGGSMLDLYIGNLSPENIASEILEKVKCNGALVKEKFTHWVCNSGDNYQQVTISDGSYWTLRLGRYPERYVHIHPSRYAINKIGRAHV